jgi:hypothetical protein
MVLDVIGYEDAEWIHLAWIEKSLVKMVMNIRAPEMVRKFLLA